MAKISFHDMDCIPEAHERSPVFYSGVSQLDISTGIAPSHRFFPEQHDLSDNLLTTSVESLEARALRICNKKYFNGTLNNIPEGEDGAGLPLELPLRFSSNDNMKKLSCSSCEATLKESFHKLNRQYSEYPETPAAQKFSSTLNLFVSHDEILEIHDDCSSSGDDRLSSDAYISIPDNRILSPYESSGDESGPDEKNDTQDTNTDCLRQDNIKQDDMSKERDIKQAILWTKDLLNSIRQDDRSLLRQFIEIRFRIESLGTQYRHWSHANSVPSCQYLSAIGTLPRNTACSGSSTRTSQFRQRAFSLRTPKIELSSMLERQVIKEM